MVGYIPAIDGMRAIAILLVVSAHLGAEHIIPGGFGVTLFFFISGFLITSLMIQEHEATGAVAIPAFYARRFLRLGPALMTMVAIVSLIFLFVDPIPLSQIMAATFYYTNYYKIIAAPPTTPLDPMWSLAVEEHYYLIFPIIFSIAWKYRMRFLQGLIVATVVVLLWRCALVIHWHSVPSRTYLATDTRIDSILYGAILAVAVSINRPFIATWCRRLWAVAAVLFVISLVIRNGIFRETIRYSLQGAALIPLFYCAVFDGRFAFVRQILATRPLIWIGKLSYSLYLWHFAVLVFSEHVFGESGKPFFLVFNAIASFTLASASYYLVEWYFLRLRNRFRTHRSTIRSAASTSPVQERTAAG